MKKDTVAGSATIAAAIVASVFALAGCGPQGGAGGAGGAGGPGGAGGAGGGPPPAEVGVVVATPRAVPLITELPGRLEASRVAEVRARVAGILLKREFREGSDVKAGQRLFRIDAAPYQAALASAQASVQRAQANLDQAAAQAERYKPLVEANAISRLEYINAVSAKAQAEADLAAARAAVQTARINLGYADVTAPIAGRIGRALVTEGALVGQGEPTQLATIQQIDPVYLNVTQSTNEVLRLRQALDSGRLAAAGGPGAARVRVVLDDGSVYPLPGTLLFSDLTVDATTGQITLRASVPNPKGLLLPGMYVRARLEQAVAQDAITLPQQAVSRGPTGDTVMVVGADGQVAPRKVTVGAAQDGQWVIVDGLKAGEQVMVDGFQKLRGNAPVKPVPWVPPGAASAVAGSNAGPGAAAVAASAPPAAAPAASR